VLAQCLSGKSIDMGGSEFEVVEKRRVVPNLAAVDARLRPLLARRGRYADRAVSGCPTFKQMRSHHELYPIARGHGFEWRNSMFELYVAVDLDTLIGLTMLLAAFRAIIRQIR
jgi:hypothetical protein